MDGLEATRRIRQRQQEPSAPPHFKQPIVIVAMTANVMQGDREKCIAAGMDDYLPKPIRPETLQALIERLAPASTQAPQTHRFPGQLFPPRQPRRKFPHSSLSRRPAPRARSWTWTG